VRRLLIACLALASCVPSPVLPPPTRFDFTPQPSAQARPTPRVQTLSLENGLVFDAPVAWSFAPAGFINRAANRIALVTNGPLADLPQLPGNGDVDASTLPAGRVAVEIEQFCRLSCRGPADETALPVDWQKAAPLYDVQLPADRHEIGVGFRWFDQPLFIVARWSDDAPPADIAAIADIAKSVRPDPPVPADGWYRGWYGLGALDRFAVGSVERIPQPPGAVRPPNQSYDSGPFYLVRGRQHTFAFVSLLPYDARCAVTFDASLDRFGCVVDSRRFEWTHFGRYLGPEPASDLAQYRVIVRDGNVWLRYGQAGILTPSVRDESAER